jgi:uncharacterized protein
MHLAWRRVSALAALAAAVVALGSWIVVSLLVAPATRAIGAPPLELGAEPVQLESPSGSALRGWVVRGRAGAGAIVLAHGVRSDRRQMLGRAAFLHAAGHALLLFDQQAHGESPGERITFGYLESHDARAAVAYARSRWPGERIGYLGVSQGGAAALLGPEPLAVDAIVLEAVYPTLREAVTDRIAIRLGPLAPMLAPLLLGQARLRVGVDAEEIAPIRGIAGLRAPLLLVAGGKDQHTPLAESERLFAAAPEPKELWVLPEATHQNFHTLATVDYEQRVGRFFAQRLYQGDQP